ncbi:MAG: SRPBCC family protein, partial [Ilumatobacteraceae bacterium]
QAAFDYMADLGNLAEWDPGVKRVTQIDGSGGGASASFDVAVAAGRGELTLRYHTRQYEEPHLVVIAARSRMLTSIDRVSINAGAGSGCLVTYDAELKLNGPLRLADFALKPMFKRIGDRAARGLVVALAGDVVAS